MDAVMLARLQFAANISFHILFPAITIGLGWVLLYFKLRYVRSRDMADYRRLMGEKLSALPHVHATSSYVAMEAVVEQNWISV